MRAGLFGYGVAGRILHAQLLERAGFELVGALTQAPERVAQLATDFPNARACRSGQELLDQGLDLVVVASRNDAHIEHARLAIDAGIPVVVDKPVAPRYSDVEALFDLANSKGVPITVFYNRLWDSDLLTISAQKRELGEIFRFESRYERWRPDVTGQSWRENVPEAQGGGVMIDLGSHLVASALHLFGPARLTSAHVRSVRGASNDDALITLAHGSGVVSVLSASAITGAPGPRVRVLGRSGALIIPEVDYQEVALRELRYEPRPSKAFFHRGDDVRQIVSVPGDWGAFYASVRSSLEGKAAMPVSQEFALGVARILEDAKEYAGV